MTMSTLVLGYDMMSKFQCAVMWPSDVSRAFALSYCAVALETDLLVIREAIEEEQAELSNEGFKREHVENPFRNLGTSVGDFSELHAGPRTETSTTTMFHLAGGVVGGYLEESIDADHSVELEPEPTTKLELEPTTS